MGAHLCAILLLAMAAIWGWTFVVVKDAIDAYSPIGFLSVRFLIGSLFLAPIVLPRILRKESKSADPGDTPSGALSPPDVLDKNVRSDSLKIGLGIGVCLALSYLFQTIGLKYTTASHTGLITGLAVLFGPLAALIVFKIRVPLIFWPSAAVALVGLALLTFGEKTTAHSVSLFGNGLSLLCAIGFGIHIALLGRYAAGRDALIMAFGQITSATAIFWMIWILSGEPIVAPDSSVWPAILLTGIVATAGGFFIQTFAQQRLSVVRTSVIIVMEPIFATIFGYWLHNDPLSWWNLMGAMMMIGAALFVELHSATTAEQDCPVITKSPDDGQD